MSNQVSELFEGVLTEAQLGKLHTDFRDRCELQEVRVKGGLEAYADPQPVTLDEAVARLRRGTAVGVQVRYVFADRHWCDTLLREPDGAIRLVRADVTPPPRTQS